MSSNQPRLDAVLEAMSPGADLPRVAAAHELTEAELRELVAAYLAGARNAATAVAPKRRRGQLFAIAAVGLLIGFGSFTAYAQSAACPQTLPGVLRTFCAAAPAIAADVNWNFQTEHDWIAMKTGPITTPAVITQSYLQTDGGITALKGNIAAPNGAVTAGASVNAGTSITAGSSITAQGNIASNGNISAAGSLSGASLSVVAPLKGSLVGGGTITCDSTSSVNWGCSSWGSGSCPSGCGEGCPAGSTTHFTGNGYCYSTLGSAYCYGWVCVQN